MFANLNNRISRIVGAINKNVLEFCAALIIATASLIKIEIEVKLLQQIVKQTIIICH